MKITNQEARVTAYALGELEGKEKRQFEADLAKSPELRKEVAALRKLSVLLTEELANEPPLELTPAQRTKIRLAPAASSEAPRSFRKRWAMAASFGGAVAAGILAYWHFGAKDNGPLVDVLARNETVPVPLEEGEYDLSATADETSATGDVVPAPKADESYAEPSTSSAAAPARMQSLGRAKGMALADGRGVYEKRSMAPMEDQRKLRESKPTDSLNNIRAGAPMNTESYASVPENPFIAVGTDPRSTFSIDVDTASYANVRRFLESGQRPPPDAVRIEEMINYFPYSYAAPTDGKPFSVATEVSAAPWNKKHRLVRIALKGKDIAWDKRPASNLVFLLDVSGSMDEPNKLPLLVESFKMLIGKLGKQDRVAIVVYAGASGIVLKSTAGDNKAAILGALDKLKAGGSTNGGAGITLAYKLAQSTFIKGGTNRVILATDGDFNVGTTNEGGLVRLAEEKAKTGVFLTVLGFGMGNYKDSTLEQIADKGNGSYAYIDSLKEAKKVLVKEAGGTLFTIAKDVKIQVEFNPEAVNGYRLIGYENRVLAHQDFNDDKKDAGDIGAGHHVTALYEVVPKGVALDAPGVDALKYQSPSVPKGEAARATERPELMTVKLRFKKPDGDKSELLEVPLVDDGRDLSAASTDFRFAAAVAAFGMLLRDSKHKGDATFRQVTNLASETTNGDELRTDFVELVKKAEALSKKK